MYLINDSFYPSCVRTSCCSTLKVIGSKFTSVPTEFFATLIDTSIAAVAFNLGHAIGSQQISINTVGSPIWKGRGTESRRHLTRQIVVVKIQLFQIRQLCQGGWDGPSEFVVLKIQKCQRRELSKLRWNCACQLIVR